MFSIQIENKRLPQPHEIIHHSRGIQRVSAMPYFAYMLRLWSSKTEAPHVWRASLESVHGSEIHVFGDLEALIAFLEHRTNELDHEETDRRGHPPNQENEK